MRTLRLLTLAALVAPATGCAWLERVKRDGVGSRPTGAVEDVTAACLRERTRVD